MTADPTQRVISVACEDDLEQHGDSFRGNGYTKSEREAAERYELMLRVVREPGEPVSVLDFGCGLAHMLDHIKAHDRWRDVTYTGLDLSPRYLAGARERHPDADLLELDVLEHPDRLGTYDYVVMNGVFNWRGEIAQDEMLAYWRRLTSAAWQHCRKGLAFNVMSKLVEWERDDLFHLPFEPMAEHVAGALSRHFVVRHDYEAFEYTTYVYRSPSRS